METEKLKELLDSMPATIIVNDDVYMLIIGKNGNDNIQYYAEYQTSSGELAYIEVKNNYRYAISVGETLEECLIDLKERIKKYI